MNQITLPDAKHEQDFVIGVEIGQARNFTAIAIFERIEALTGKAEKGRWTTQVRYDLRHLERPPLGTSYPAIIDRLKKLIARLSAHRRLKLVVNQTGYGRPVIDLMRREKLIITLIAITVAGVAHLNNGAYHVPKFELVSNLQILLQSRRLAIDSALPEAKTLVEQLQNFEEKTTAAGDDAYDAWRKGDHDDLLLASAIACWYGEKKLGSILHLPPMPRPPIEMRPPTMDELWAMQPKNYPEETPRI